MRFSSIFKAVAVVAAVAVAGPSSAQDWKPDGSLTLQIGFAAGGSTDTIGRVIGQTIEEQTGWNVIVENKPGGGGVAMFTGIANRPADGSVMGMGVNMPILINLVRRGDELGFNVDSFDYLATVASTPLVLVAMADAPFDDLEGFVEYAKGQGEVAIAFDAPPQKLAMSRLSAATGIQANMVSTKGGSEIMKLLLGGQVIAGFSAGEHFPYAEAGKMKIIGTPNPDRVSWAPEAKTFLEVGANIYLEPVFYIATTAGTAPEAVEALAKAIDDALASDAVKEVVANTIKNQPNNLGPEGTKAMMVNGIPNVQALFE